MPIFITKINSASTQVTFNYLNSEAVWGLIVSSSYEFDISDTSYTDGDDILYEGKDALDQVYLNQNIVGKIGSDEIRNGLVTSIDYPETPNVGRTTASISIEERQRVPSHGALSDILNNVPSPHDVESFSESFTFERGENSYSRNRNISLKYKQDAGHFFIDKARIFVQSMFFDSRPSFGYQEDGISENARFDVFFKPIVSENINLLNKEISFTETVTVNNIETLGDRNYSSQVSVSIDTDQIGYTTKNYKASLKALQEPLEANILDAIQDFIQNTYDENSSLFNFPTTITKNINTDGGSADISISFTNNPSKNSITNVVYTASKTKSGQWDEYSFDINIISVGASRIAAFNQTKQYWETNIDIGLSKVQSLFPETSSSILYEKSRNTTFSKFERRITDKIIYTNDPSYNSSGNILKRGVSVSDQIGVQRNSLLPILGERILLRKRDNSKTISSRTVQVNLVSKNLQSVESEAITIAESHTPPASYYYVDSKTSSHSPTNGTSSATVTFNYFD